jgi:8-oxo-dGTP diphosphatase
VAHIADLVQAVQPHNAREAADQADILAWVAAGQPLFRTNSPNLPPKHLVVYFVPVDEKRRSVLLGAHRKAGLWLPPGGHVEDGEDPRQTVCREAQEELGITPAVPEKPFFLTITPTNETSSHLDVSLWFLLDLAEDAELHPDPREFSDVRWFPLDRDEGWPDDTYDPEMGRFAAKLAEEKQPPGGYRPR